MSNITAITGSSKIVYRNQGGGSKKQGIASSTNLSMWSHVAFRNRNVVCPYHRHHVFCMNQLGGVGAGGIPGRSYAFAPGADGVNKNKILCGINHSNIPIHILQKINYKKLLIDYGVMDFLAFENFNKNNLSFGNTGNLSDNLKQNLQPNKHYILEFNLYSNPTNYKVFFTIVKNINNPDWNSFDIKNVSPTLNINYTTAINVKLYELVTKYI